MGRNAWEGTRGKERCGGDGRGTSGQSDGRQWGADGGGGALFRLDPLRSRYGTLRYGAALSSVSIRYVTLRYRAHFRLVALNLLLLRGQSLVLRPQPQHLSPQSVPLCLRDLLRFNLALEIGEGRREIFRADKMRVAHARRDEGVPADGATTKEASDNETGPTNEAPLAQSKHDRVQSKYGRAQSTTGAPRHITRGHAREQVEPGWRLRGGPHVRK